MHLSSKDLGPSESEAEVFEIPTRKVLDGYPPMPEGIKVAFFCDYLQEVELQNSKTIPVIVEITHLYLDDRIITDKEKIDIACDAIARVGRGYATLDHSLETPLIP
jgi:flavin reductase (DIM6/NTAB) family NADH-FMN oxidoreductase RutF